ncbi:polysaccharide biosynthesis tyrosine autokinase [Nocardioides sp.]|uniref:polysaccharide biosynthesis tyrosine autokinase n=1 Tax=Nocardioides sp. TaxID=35761 RepID=UPI0035160EC3
MELTDYWRTIRRRWRLIVATVLLAAGASGLMTWQATPLYASSAQLFVSTAATNTGEASVGNQFATQRVASYVNLVGTRKLADAVAAAMGGRVPAGALRGSVSAAAVPATVNLTITARNPDPVLARDIAQAYAVALSDLVSEIETPEGQTSAPVRVSIVDNAQLSLGPISPNPRRNLTLGLALGLLLGAGLAVLRDLLDTSITTTEDVATVTQAPVLANIGSDAAAVRLAPHEALQDTTPWAEAFRVLRTNMQYVEVDHDRRVFVISSSLPGEGKSTTSANLAVTLALAGESVVLVECDLRRPTMADRLGLDGAVGTTSVLIGRVKLDDALQAYGDTGLQVLPCGHRPPNPAELLQSQAMETLLQDLRARFDIVLIDAPPLLPVTDAALLAARSDGLLAVVKHGRTTREQLRHALERVESVDAKVVGTVVNQVPSRRRGSGYGYGYGYGYSYAPTPERAARRRFSLRRA